MQGDWHLGDFNGLKSGKNQAGNPGFLPANIWVFSQFTSVVPAINSMRKASRILCDFGPIELKEIEFS